MCDYGVGYHIVIAPNNNKDDSLTQILQLRTLSKTLLVLKMKRTVWQHCFIEIIKIQRVYHIQAEQEENINVSIH